MIDGPAPYAGHNIGSGFTDWTQRSLDIDAAEAALVLRRTVFISSGRGVDLDAPGKTTGPMGGCWSWQPERARQAIRNIGSAQDFSDRAEVLTLEDQPWLAFED